MEIRDLLEKARNIREKVQVQQDTIPVGGRHSQMGGRGVAPSTKERQESNKAFDHLQRLREEEAETLEDMAQKIALQGARAQALRQK